MVLSSIGGAVYTIRDVMIQAKKLGVHCTARTFWQYYKLGLLPDGRKLLGHGNVMFFPDDTATRLWLIGFLTRELGFTLSDLRRFHWSEFRALPAENTKLKKEFIFAAKRDFEDARAACLKKVLADIAALLKNRQTAPCKAANAPEGASKSNHGERKNNRAATGGKSRADILAPQIAHDAKQEAAHERRIRPGILG
jgi:DNA-binding transcriptional MerR regulator